MMNTKHIRLNNETVTITGQSLRNLISKIPDIDTACREVAAYNNMSFDDTDLTEICRDFLTDDDNIQDALLNVEMQDEIYFAHNESEMQTIEFEEWKDDNLHLYAIIAALFCHAFHTIEDIDIRASVFDSIDTSIRNIYISTERKHAWELTNTEKNLTEASFDALLKKWIDFLT